MTLHLVDVASYQGNLQTENVVRAGFHGVNLKVSHGLGAKSVHPDITGWVTRAKAAGLGVSTFHYLDGSAAGADQARYVHSRLQFLGLATGTAHQVDCESTATLVILRDYLTTMQDLLGRPVAVYTGDWWWQPLGWDVTDLTPYLWAAPNAGYPGTYPGDDSPHWTAGYGGWPDLSVMQYAVGPLDGAALTINVSKSAIRDPQVWAALTGEATDMTNAPGRLVEARTYIRSKLTEIPLTSMGIVGDDNHAQSGSSYHLGKSALRPDSYTITESSRDRNGLSEAASALDFGWWQRTIAGNVHNLRTYSAWLVAQCKAGTADTADIREVIYSPDGKTVKRWDRLGKRSTGDNSHLTHTHTSYFRDSEGRDKTALFRRYFTEIGLEEDDMPTPAEYAAAVWGHHVVKGDSGPETWPAGLVLGDGRRLDIITHQAISALDARLTAIAAQVAAIHAGGDVDEAAIVSGILQGMDYRAVADAVVAALPADQAKKVLDALAARLAA